MVSMCSAMGGTTLVETSVGLVWTCIISGLIPDGYWYKDRIASAHT
jgi:hypothetical protein